MAKPAELEGLQLEEEEQPSLHGELPLPETPHELQAAVEGAAYGDTVEFLGEEYRIADSIGLMPLMRFAYIARKGTRATDDEGLAAMYDLLRCCMADDEWERFEADATEKRADEESLLHVVRQAIELMSARPTRRPSDSSAGPPETSPSSTGSSSSPATPTGAEVRKLRPANHLVSVEDLVKQAGG